MSFAKYFRHFENQQGQEEPSADRRGTRPTGRRSCSPNLCVRQPNNAVGCEVSQENFVVARNRYTTFEEFKADAISYVSEFAREFDIKTFQRVGLRYVNHIDLPAENGIRTLQRYLKAPVDFARVEIDNVEQFLSEFRLKVGEHKLTVRGALLRLPTTPGNLLYILDLDCYDVESRSAGDLEPLLDVFHHEIQVGFLEHLTDEYKTIMRGAA